MQKFHFSTQAIPNTKISIFDQYGQILRPADNGFLGVFRQGTKLSINIEVAKDVPHSCYTLNPEDLSKVAKAITKSGSYVKNVTIDTFTGENFTVPGEKGSLSIPSQAVKIARWPANMVCLEVPGHTFNIGFANQNGRIFFVIEEYLTTPADLPEGRVVSFSILRGVGVVAYKPGFDARIHWTNVPFNQKDGLRMLQTGDYLVWKEEDIVTLGGDTSFRYEISKVDF